MFNMWRNDTRRNLRERALHLLTKSYPALRWVWVVGDSEDETYAQLLTIVNEVRPLRRVDLIRHDTGIVGNDMPNRLRRMSETANQWLAQVQADDDYLLIHESDIISPVNLVERFLRHVDAGRCPVAGWPILPVTDTQAVFYDIWAYRKDGRRFTNTPPFHECYNPNTPFEVDSVGTCWLLHAEDIRRGARFTNGAVVELCEQLRGYGRRFWVDPKLVVVQPKALWEPHNATV